MKCIINGKLVLPEEVVEDKALLFDDTIAEIADASAVDAGKYETIDAAGMYVAPGLLDMHIHGYAGEDTSDAKEDGLLKMCRALAENGVTSWCPTTMTVAKEEILAAFDTVRKVHARTDCYGAKVLGVNCEGPFINPSKKGAQAEEHILRPDAKFILDNADIVRVFTIAPEMDGGLECIREVYEDGRVLVSMGHTGATYEEAMAGIQAGVRHATHLFNAMTPLMHRNPGVVGAALSSDNVSCELIADTFHVNKGLFGLVAKIKKDKLCLITDCMRAGGMPDGTYTLGGQPVHKTGIKCLLEDGTIAASVLKLNEAVRNLYENTELTIAQAVACASLNPAKALKVDDKIGSLEAGKCADIIIFDDQFNIQKTIIGGNTVCEKMK
ncbi:MAG: N-acetylglucosamine-6-phosphate deacetylase [Clostridiales bacterium]|nr:N-acetylglucosamine-6-phosphate deacetylase [Clostridiales bacterium]